MSPERTPPGVAPSERPTLAGLHDALLDGHDHYAPDRAALAALLEIAPGAQAAAKDHRAWMHRVIRFLTVRRGIDQYLDLGSGLPTAENTHQVVQRHNPEAHVVYVDDDPVVQAHGRALLEENDRTFVSGADLTKPGETLLDPVLARNLDFTRPLGLIVCSVAHHIDDLERARKIVHSYVDALAPGSYVLLSHLYDPRDGGERSTLAVAQGKQFQGTGFGSVCRDRDEIASLFEGLELIPPGLVHPHEWWPEGPRLTSLTDSHFTTLAGVGRKP
jgi:SAM-dependent methyltransferase